MKLKLLSAIAGVGLVGIIIHTINSVYAENGRLNQQNASLKQQNQRQQLITDNAYQSIRLFNDISRINSENRNRSAVDSEQTKTAIKTVVANHDCANRIVPDGVAIRLQQHANRIRSSATDTHSGTFAR
ncbi:putative bacteriophage protein [Xenorhabdus poinarii G6]|uniref:Putative bacteriophage protein n=1 Tax=Xenorhabdus poinarii G6 TaxID=1354304 RepID=A0A068R1J3_9GAMM|nr:DUF2570 domain-containing protein [Xenorhabdus poinarii]CDG19985.1 putative bacteriophage protein [Xenorhabdus poinarii G6]